MDDFGVLVKRYGIKPQSNSSPMTSSKTTNEQLIITPIRPLI